jgi:hypothetical protein
VEKPAPDAVTFRPQKTRKVCVILAAVVVVFFAVIGAALSGSVGGGEGVFQLSDQIAMGVLGVLGALGILAFARPRVVADEHGVRIRNVVGGYELPWEVVRGIRFERGNPWVSLELEDDDMVSIMAIQAVDKEYAVAAARALRALLAQHRAAAAARTD